MLIPLTAVPLRRAQAEPVLDKAMERCANMTAAMWLDRCEQDMAQLWNDCGYWAITEVFETKGGRAIHCVAAAGDFEPSLVSEMEDWARRVGCRHAYFSGRKGWARKLPDYEVASITLIKEL